VSTLPTPTERVANKPIFTGFVVAANMKEIHP
jgi:hypothetical protein